MAPQMDLDDFSAGYVVGLLVGEGHFGGDGRQPQVTLRMHTRHEQLFRWLQRRLPGGTLYGPYTHGGRSYFQWMARGQYLRTAVAPFLHARRDWLDEHAWERFSAMCERYGIELEAASAPPAAVHADGDAVLGLARRP